MTKNSARFALSYWDEIFILVDRAEKSPFNRWKKIPGLIYCKHILNWPDFLNAKPVSHKCDEGINAILSYQKSEIAPFRDFCFSPRKEFEQRLF